MNKGSFTKNNVIRAIVIIGVIIIPLMYSFFYLSAFWDPYSRLDTLPVALVNNDTGATINSKDRNLGKEMCDKLEEDGTLKFIMTDEADAKKGTYGKKYYAMIVIPENFSSNVASASEPEKHTAVITFSPNEKKNYLAGQILSKAVLKIESSTRETVTKELVQTLADQINGVPSQMTELQDGLNTLSDGADKLATGSNDLKTGTSEFATKFDQYSQGVAGVQSGAKQVNDGANTLSAGSKQLNDGITSYTAGVDSLIGNVKSTSDFLSSYVKAHPEVMKDPTFAAFLQKMSDPNNAKSIAALQSAGTQLKAASSQISTGSANLATGSKTLSDGTATLNGATAQLDTAANKIATGAKTLSDGTVTLKDGVNTAKTGVTNSINDANKQLSALDGLSDFASKPVEFKSDVIHPIPNYGTYFSPYFMSLSLWVGALIIFFGIYLDADGRFAILSRNSTNRVARSFIYLLIGFAQAIVLGIVIVAGLGLDVKHLGLFFLSVCLVSMVFISIVQFCLVHLGDLGKFFAIALLILQLTSCGGTFPMETVPKFFNILFPFMPMTYSVALFKDTISGTITSDFWINVVVLSAILVAFFLATVLWSHKKKERANLANA